MAFLPNNPNGMGQNGQRPMPGNTGIVPPAPAPVALTPFEIQKQYVMSHAQPGWLGHSMPVPPMNTGIVPPAPAQPRFDENYRNFIRARLGLGGLNGDSTRPDTPLPIPARMGANGGHPVINFNPYHNTYNNEPSGYTGYGATGMRPIVPFENRPRGMGGYGSLYDEIG